MEGRDGAIVAAFDHSLTSLIDLKIETETSRWKCRILPVPGSALFVSNRKLHLLSGVANGCVANS